MGESLPRDQEVPQTIPGQNTESLFKQTTILVADLLVIFPLPAVFVTAAVKEHDALHFALD